MRTHKPFLLSLAAIVIALSSCSHHSYQSIANMPDNDLQQFAKKNVEMSKRFIGYPGNESSNLKGFYEWYTDSKLCYVTMNNAGDPFDGSDDMCSFKYEKEVLEFFAPFYGMDKNNMWGIVTASGTDGNNHGIYFGEKTLEAQVPNKKPIAYISKESHYSNMRLCDLQNIEVRLIDIDNMGRMNPESLRKALDPTRPALIIFSMGSTFMGAIDDQDALNKVIDEVKPIAVFRHVDAALFGGYLPYTEYKNLVDINKCRYNSIAISGHKFFGIDTPCGLFFTTKDVIKSQTAYMPEYLNGNMVMINCSRSAVNPLKFYWIIKTLGEEGLTKQANAIIKNTEYLKTQLDKIGWPAWRNDHSNTVFFKRPSDRVIKKYFLAKGHNDNFGGNLSHIVVMQHVTPKVIDSLIDDLKKEQ